jgi:hypothetical protein
MILLVVLGKRFSFNANYLILPFIMFVYISVAGTKDYLTINRIRWQAYFEVKQETNLPADKINGGFEVNCWNDGVPTWWSDFVSIERFDYLIQFTPEPGFEVKKEFDFQRYFPFKKDKIVIFKRKEQHP